MSKEKEASKESSKVTRKKRIIIQELLELDSETLNSILNLIGKIGASALSSRYSSTGFGVGIDSKKVIKAQTDIPTLKDIYRIKLNNFIASILSSIHIFDDHKEDIDEHLEKVTLENKVELFNQLIATIKSHEAYNEIIFILEPFGQRFEQITGRLLSLKKDEITVQIYEIILVYSDLNRDEKKISFELSRTQINSLISDLQKILGE